jgi:hypothetical protein
LVNKPEYTLIVQSGTSYEGYIRGKWGVQDPLLAILWERYNIKNPDWFAAMTGYIRCTWLKETASIAGNAFTIIIKVLRPAKTASRMLNIIHFILQLIIKAWINYEMKKAPIRSRSSQ